MHAFADDDGPPEKVSENQTPQKKTLLLCSMMSVSALIETTQCMLCSEGLHGGPLGPTNVSPLLKSIEKRVARGRCALGGSVEVIEYTFRSIRRYVS